MQLVRNYAIRCSGLSHLLLVSAFLLFLRLQLLTKLGPTGATVALIAHFDDGLTQLATSDSKIVGVVYFYGFSMRDVGYTFFLRVLHFYLIFSSTPVQLVGSRLY
uniref:Uncharacterized protein n=1 Tax=Anopheles atroparvus TaxID=41427 RepID=A0AAG5CQT2_ANOAO